MSNVTQQLKLQRLTERKAPHQQESDRQCHQAYELLQRAESHHYRNKDELKAANQAFVSSLKADEHNAHAYAGLGYLFLLVGERDKAATFLHQALALDHLNQNAHHLLSYLEQEGAPYSKIKHVSDHDHMHDTLEASIVQIVHLVMQQPPPVPTTKPQVLKNLQSHLDEETQTYQRLLAQLAIVEKEIHVEDLRKKLRPLEVHLKRLNAAVADSQEFLSIAQQMLDCRPSVTQITEQLKGERTPELIHTLEPLFEHLMDQCDIIADQLDHLEQKGLNIQALVTQYEKLIAVVENLHNQLDD